MEETIAAIATPFGEGGIGIIRISGGKARAIITSIFRPADNCEYIPTKNNRKMVYGKIINYETQEPVDEVLAVFMEGPKTYTCEDVVEIHCHGSVVALGKILKLCYKCGARPAEKGEFTKRAFLGGRIDLSQAEAVMDMVSAKTPKLFEVALCQLEGLFSREIAEMRRALLDILVEITVNIDYPDEDIEEIIYKDLQEKVEKIENKVDSLLGTSQGGRIIKDGLNLVIAGRPNVGKSSLMNVLLRENRAIVTEIPGTTRDTIEETLNIGGIPIKLIDTAGIRATGNLIEQIGIERSKASLNRADMIIFIVDGSCPLEDEDRELMSFLKERKGIVLINKMDKGRIIDETEIRELLPDIEIVHTSLKPDVSFMETGAKEIEEIVKNLVSNGEVWEKNRAVITNERHEQLLNKCRVALQDGINMIKSGEALDFLEIDLHRAYDALGEITGETISDNILESVFSRFCLGK